MCDLRQDGNLETDHLADFSLMNSRLDSFRGSSLAQQVPAERLARAGFYFTGQADRVRCFCCKKTVENWCMGDTPVERHKEVSPSCTFLSCTHRTSFNPSSDTTLTNGSIYNEAAEDLEYRLRTGEVVDESTYPMAPHMKSEEARLQTFSSWPSTAPVTPQDLAQAGLYYLGESDRVQCFCCGGMLGGWEAGDTAWGEHTKHFPNCFFILGHDVGNIPFLGGTEEEEESSSRQHRNTQVLMGSFEERLGSFAGVQHPIDHERLARAGFYSTGTGDRVLCFRCGGGLKGWQPEEDPWEEHAKHYPGCSFLLVEKGQEFVNSIQLQDPRRNGATSSHQNGFSGHTNEVLQSDMAQNAIGMGLEPCVVEKTILMKIRRTGSGYSSLEALLEDCFNNTPESATAMTEQQDEDPLEKLMKLQREKQCKICMDKDISIVFIPCGHLVTCETCSKKLVKCPICCGAILQKLKTYIS
ncbi:E3 ubiquitin-protein ligase XIAP isoform X1 [Seriola lalandi dorsalis]|uniref:E3 ubiquitin-protein ligase XIAP n=2 Tax=Seriola lalandi dorsalis TaxID=1841481 RepID=A0A3B4YMH8_SERLL|nr:E3 ubiquitin-protein ligase XIAP isoform X1 [Seriola lalandi dorsalis]XP_023251658.1 E3 ubiquitin-protein ligase XIAP isoform X1 [Seriola lalandi dorsalis]XP_023251659.1 E3 ubiquitin-protein ligase XIAP isoform X1 [Seriola lalandi dorsalis]XP_056239314.1 E3 ubiquitin-protein ligase XIAP isoform X1 [Seriola aureovittata]XP_056239315.1 E3 ubiquitin-protein ligase XIAP isoform X1 [Seriola aureovittata]